MCVQNQCPSHAFRDAYCWPRVSAGLSFRNVPEAVSVCTQRGNLCDQVHCCSSARCLWLSLDVSKENKDPKGRKVPQDRKEKPGRKVHRGLQGPRENRDPRVHRDRWDLLGQPEQRLISISMWFAGVARLRAIRAGK